MPRVIVYARCSTDEQTESGLGIKAQLAACMAHAERQGWAVAGVEKDEGLSGSKPADQRPGLVSAIAAMEPGGVILVLKRDRLVRGDPAMVAMIESAIRKHGGRVVSTAGEGCDDDSPASILFRRLIDAFGEYELLLIRARTRAALEMKKAKGERRGSVPSGSKIEPDDPARSKAGHPCKLRSDPAEASAIGAMRRWRAEGRSFRAIARRLDAAGIRPRSGRAWAPSSIKAILERLTDAQHPQE